MRTIFKTTLLSCMCVFSLVQIESEQAFATEESSSTAKPNVLFISIDDLNDHVEFLQGYPGKMITPNLDRLAAMGTAFTNAHCAAPICNTSRTATMFGVRASTSGVYANNHRYRQSPVLKDALTLPQYLRTQHGYSAQGAGKIFHALEWAQTESDGINDPASWDSFWPSMERQMPRRVVPENMPLARGRNGDVGKSRGAMRFMDWGPIGHPSEAMPDHKVTNWAIDQLSLKHDKPFFIACGIFRPHIPWYVPQEYLDMYPLDEIQVPENSEGWLERLPASIRDNPFAGAARRPWHRWIAESGEWEKAIQGYLASVTYADAQVGRLLDAFEKSAYKDNTIIVLWSDHGAHLGDKGTWEKYSLWHESTRVPLIFVAPGVTKPGTICKQPASLLDIYPTLLELLDIPKPGEQLEGISLLPQLKDPENPKPPAVCTHGNNNHAVISAMHRYIRYANGAEELYDFTRDPGEWNNMASDPNAAKTIEALSKHLPSVNNEFFPAPRRGAGAKKPAGDQKARPKRQDRKPKPADQSSNTANPAKQPNFVIVIGDDHGVYQSSAYGLTEYKTPHMESLAQDGIRLTNADVASPACGPSRAALFTGLMPRRNGIVGNHERNLKPEVKSLLPVLLDQGYEVVFRGKVGHGRAIHHRGYIPEGVTILPGSGKRITLEKVEQYLADRKDTDRPIALFIGPTDTHRPWPDPNRVKVNPADVKVPERTFDTPETRRELARYATAVEDTDRVLGRARKLAEKYLDVDNTLVMYTSDHGQAWPFGKWSLYETGIRVPVIAAWPGQIEPGTTNGAMVSWIDLMPTLVEHAGGEVPEGLDGKSMTKVLRGSAT